MSGELAFFEIGVADADKARVFYERLFGWTLRPGPHAGYMIQTPTIPGGLHGGDPGAAPLAFFRVDDIDAAARTVRELGGSVEDLDIEGDSEDQATFGRFRMCKDDQGSPFGLHQAPPAT